MDASIHKSIGNEWVWLTRYRGLKTRFYIAIPEGRSIEVGVGYAPNGMPRGAKSVIAKSTVMSFWGFSSLYARAADHQGLCQVSVFKNVDPDDLPTDLGF